MSEELQLSRSSVHNILKKDLNLSKLAPKFVPCLLTEEQRHFRVSLCEDNIQSLKDDPLFLSRIVTGDKSWVSVFELELKTESKQWLPKGRHTQRPQKALRNRLEKKVMLTVFWDQQGVVFTDFLPPRQTVTAEYYGEIIRQLKEAVRRKRPRLWARDEEGNHEMRL